jgi:sulfite reductase (ferredoxin)
MADISPIVEEEINQFEQAVNDFLSQKISDAKFQRIRLQHGVYGQRQDGVQMIRIKIPSGDLTAEQFEAIADVCADYSKGIAHITTRQDIQIHYVNVRQVPELMRRLAAVGITTREACGNTIRNVTASPYAGVDPAEPFDVRPYAYQTTRHFLRNPICQNMGRKFKIAFEGSPKDYARLMIHDIGVLAKSKNGKRGFQIFVGGGLGATPFVAKEFYDFLSEEELIPFCESILRVFDRFGERKIRSKARMKFVVKKFGFEKFKAMVEAERKVLKVNPAWNDYLQTVEVPVDEIKHKAVGEKVEESAEFLLWKKTNARTQKQDGFAVVDVRLVLGDMVPDQMRRLADITRKYCGGKLCLTIEQNMVLRWVYKEDLPALYEELKTINMALPQANTLYDVTACPGTDTCRLGIAASRPLAKVLEERLAAENGEVSELANDLHIKISGCPNSCGQHHLGNIGFHGAALPQEGHTVPAFQLMLGGGVKPDGETTIAQIVTKVPSKNTPDAVVLLLKHYLKNRNNDEEFNQFYERIGRKATEELLEELTQVKTFKEDTDFYVDWGDKEEFGLQKGVIGECAGSPVSDVVPTLADATPFLEQARALLIHKEFDAARAKTYEALAKTCDALLITKMVQTFNSGESIQEFDNHFVRTGDLATLKDFRYRVDAWMNQDASEQAATALMTLTEETFALCEKQLV